MDAQRDLFADQSLPDGMDMWPDFISPGEEARLAAAIDAAPLSPFRFHQWEGKRLTAAYGFGYDYGRGRTTEAPAFPAWLRTLADDAARRAGLVPAAIVQGLLIRYDPGAGIGWHRDKAQFGAVLGLSLSSDVVLRLRRRLPQGFERRAVILPRGSLYRLDGAARWD